MDTISKRVDGRRCVLHPFKDSLTRPVESRLGHENSSEVARQQAAQAYGSREDLISIDLRLNFLLRGTKNFF